MLDCFRPANGLMHQTIEMDDETLVDEIQDDLGSDGEETVFEEYNEPQGIFLEEIEQTASEADDLQVLTVL
jgi:hypothetical protein